MKVREIMYIYPDNLKAKAALWLWQLRDVAVLGIGLLLSVFALAQLGTLIPFVITACYGFLSIRFSDTSILDFIRYAVAFFITKQQGAKVFYDLSLNFYPMPWYGSFCICHVRL